MKLIIVSAILSIFPVLTFAQTNSCTVDYSYSVFNNENALDTENWLKQCISSGEITSRSTDRYGNPLLYRLAGTGPSQDAAAASRVIEFAISHGFDVNVQDSQTGRTPLHGANSPEAVQALLRAGANVNLRNNDGQFPIHLITGEAAVRSGALNALLIAGVRVNVRSNNGSTPLHTMAYSSRLPAGYELLLSYGVDPSIENYRGDTAYDILINSSNWPWPMLAETRVLRVLKDAAPTSSETSAPSQVRMCNHVYVGQRFEGRERLAGLISIGATYEVLGFSARTEQVTVRSLNGGNSYNIHCSQVTP